ncbi:MAG TPA: M20/M25/M40 family metallo-hydrolase, partial [Steroidobacteraceae bacterium]|nr:M20/M25/M40 family metallo-hydrolase [Steroidobacteraceae bacterium]
MFIKHWIAVAITCATQVAAAQAPTVDATRISEIVKTLASDEFEGRAPGTPGEEKTVRFVSESLRSMGIEPGGQQGAWAQEVPIVRTQIGRPSTFSIASPKQQRTLVQGREVYVSSLQKLSPVVIDKAPIVFVGYGITAPERDWDDFKNIDLRGKVAVFLVNDPDFAALPNEAVVGKFGDRRMTYYGRWTYKFDEAARRGAIAALIVHETEGAGYGWDTVVAPGGENYDLARTTNPRLQLQGWLEGQAAAALLKAEGLDLASLRTSARRSDFKPVELANAKFSAHAPLTVVESVSRNVLGKITGSQRADESVMFSAHWDAYGVGAPDAQGRRVRPGANDDALGVAGVLELARVFANSPKPQRTMVFALWTAEERGLLGSEAYAAEPIYPLAKTAANLTLDILQTAGPSRDVLLVGAGQSSLEDDLTRAAARQQRVITPEALPERGLFYRADHFSLAKRGVPVLLNMALAGAYDLQAGGREAGERWLSDFTANCYLQACDQWLPSWDLRGAVQE